MKLNGGRKYMNRFVAEEGTDNGEGNIMEKGTEAEGSGKRGENVLK